MDMVSLEKIAIYLKDSVFGKILYTDELTYALENDTLEGVYSDQIIFANPVRSDYGYSFDMFLSANEIVYELDEHKERGAIRSNHTGISVFRYELAERKSSNMVIFGKDEREKFENEKHSYSRAIQQLYDTSTTYHDGKWMMIELANASLINDIEQLLRIKRKPNKKQS